MRRLFIFIFIPLLLTSSGEFLMKSAVNKWRDNGVVSPSITEASPQPHREEAMVSLNSVEEAVKQGESLMKQPKIILGIMFNIIASVLWVMAMSRFQLSFLYPFLSMNFMVVIIGSQWILGEEVSWYRYAAVILIIIGLVFISKSPNSESLKEKS